MGNNETEITITNEEVSSNQELRFDVPVGSKSVLSKDWYKYLYRKGESSGVGLNGSKTVDISTVGEIFFRSSPEDTKILIENCQFNTLKKLVVPTKGLSFKEEDHLVVKQNICSRSNYQKKLEDFP